MVKELHKSRLDFLNGKTIKELVSFEGDDLKITTSDDEIFIIKRDYGHDSTVYWELFGKHNLDIYPKEFTNQETLNFGWITKDRFEEIEIQEKEQAKKYELVRLERMVKRLGLSAVENKISEIKSKEQPPTETE